MRTTTSTAAVSSLSFRESKTYVMSALFVAGNIILPQLCHLVPWGGLTWLPIYFFTLIAAYRYGLAAGLLTAVVSPVANSLLFGMPAAAMLPIILTKSVLLAVAASFFARRAGGVALWAVVAAVVAYQSVGLLAEWGMSGSLAAAFQDVHIGWPGLLVQVFGGYALMKRLSLR